MKRKSVIEKSESMIGKIDPRYALKSIEIAEIQNGSENWFYAICHSFNYGYMQGVKAAKAEMKRGNL